MTNPLISCPWWCTDHRSGPTADDEQHALIFPAPDRTAIALLCGTRPFDPVELAFEVEAYDRDSARAREFAGALLAAVEVFDRVRGAGGG